ncbi:MAG: S46 family peptidase [Bacteroidota bacterium]|nr:S46 family peptidase [Bacteroidota bacterium]
MKNFLLVLIFSFFFVLQNNADEGMWLPQLLHIMNEKDMQALGLKLSADELYSINNSSIKDAIVSLNNGGCSGEMISKEGLLLTNHHCAFSVIQAHSSIKNDYLEDGFWAMSRDDELPNENLTASFLISIEDVTKRIFSEFSDEMSEEEKNAKIKEVSAIIEKEKIEGTHYTAEVKSFFGGNNFYVLVYETFQDVRLVGAPPSSIGKFGGDTDNWMWPRHTGDFALFRIYCAPDGTPAKYSTENVPYEPKHHLPIQLEGIGNNDYTMIFGFPGTTDRYLTSYGVKQALDIKNPTIVNIRAKKLEIIKSAMDTNQKIKIQYAAKYAQTSNYWKYFIGQSKGLKRMRVYDKKIITEKKFIDWVKEDSVRNEKYGEVLNIIESAYVENEKISKNRLHLNEAIFMGAEILYFSFKMHNAISKLPSEEKQRDLAISKIKKDANEFYKNYNSVVDEKLLAEMLKMYYYSVPKSQHASIFKKIEKQMLWLKRLDFEYYAKNTFVNSIFKNKDAFFLFLKNPSTKIIASDPAYKTISSIYNFYIENISGSRKSIRERLKVGNRLFIAGIQEMDTVKNYYPNANSTMRVTYGTIGDYKPGDAMLYNYYTTIDGIIEKEDSSNSEFTVPNKLKKLYELGDYGEYADENGTLRINFISNNDITGGNSGSPVINAWGEIVGTAFDGNWEAMSGDIAFENDIQRTISVDIRYILFIIDKFAGAKHLIDEMTIAPKHNSLQEKISELKNY